jgi:hypothetical protein
MRAGGKEPSSIDKKQRASEGVICGALRGFEIGLDCGD